MAGTSRAERTHRVVVNGEGRHSVWPTYVDVPPGWLEEGTAGTIRECLERVEETWQGMRPGSTREQVATTAGADHG